MLWECGFAINDKNKKEWNFPPTIKVNTDNGPISVKNDHLRVKLNPFRPEKPGNWPISTWKWAQMT